MSATFAAPRQYRGRERRGVYDSDESDDNKDKDGKTSSTSMSFVDKDKAGGGGGQDLKSKGINSSKPREEFRFANRRSSGGLGLDSDDSDYKETERDEEVGAKGVKAGKAKIRTYFGDDDYDDDDAVAKSNNVMVVSRSSNNNSKQFVPKDITKVVSNSQNNNNVPVYIDAPVPSSKDSWAPPNKKGGGSSFASNSDPAGRNDEKENNSSSSTSKGWNSAKPNSKDPNSSSSSSSNNSNKKDDANSLRVKAVIGGANDRDKLGSDVDDDDEADAGLYETTFGFIKAAKEQQQKEQKEKKAVNILDSSLVPTHVPSQGLSADALAQHILKTSMEHSFVTVAHNRGIRTPMVQCVIVRDKSSMHNRLYPTYELTLQENNRQLILAQKQEMNRTSNYRLFDMTRGVVSSNLSKKSGNYLGKLKATNSNGTEYVLIGNKETKEEFGGVVFDRTNLLNQLKDGSQPRKMTVLLPKINRQTNEPIAYTRDKEEVDNMAELLKKNTNALLSPNFHLYETKDPVFEGGNYRLNFNGRVSVPSVKNFQLVSVDDDNDIICQFGKVGEDRFHLDFKAPMNAIQAFSLALCQFNI